MTAFGHYTTAREVVQGLDLTGKVALVTGGNAGEAIKHQASRASNIAVRAQALISKSVLGIHLPSDAVAGIGTKTVDALACAGCHVLLTSRSVHGDVRLCSRAGQQLRNLLLMNVDLLRLANGLQRMLGKQAQRFA